MTKMWVIQKTYCIFRQNILKTQLFFSVLWLLTEHCCCQAQADAELIKCFGFGIGLDTTKDVVYGSFNMSDVSEIDLQQTFSQSSTPYSTCHHRDTLLKRYSNASSQFIACAVCNAKPVQFCGHCASEYRSAEDAWKKIENDGTCKVDILVSDRLQIVSQTHDFVHTLWDGGLCGNCYDETSGCTPKNSTLNFLQLYNKTMECFEKFTPRDTPGMDDNISICQNCSKEYKDLNAFYVCVADDDLCMDMIDLMNRTRVQWKDNNCWMPGRNYTVVATLGTFVCLLPLFFYLTAKIHGTKKKQKLVEGTQRRQRMSTSASSRLYAGTIDSIR